MSGISDKQLLAVIATGNGSARDILDAIVAIVLNVQQQRGSQTAVV